MIPARVGLGLGLGVTWGSSGEFRDLVVSAEENGWDSLWFSEHLTGPTPAQVPQLGFAAAVTRRIRLGTSVTVVPGRSPVDLAKQLWTLNELADGRLLPIVGLGTAEPAEHAAFGIARADRGPWLDAALPVIRRLVAGETVDCATDYFKLPGIGIGATDPRPIVSFWMGGRSERELRRVASLADGWLASFATPTQTTASIHYLRAAARDHGRAIDEDHYGLLFPYARSRRPESMSALLAAFHPDDDPDELCPVGPDALLRTLRDHAAAGVSKFVLVPADRPADWSQYIAKLRTDVDAILTEVNREEPE